MKLLFVQFWHLWFWRKRFLKINLFFEVFGLKNEGQGQILRLNFLICVTTIIDDKNELYSYYRY
jgi:hypothetical protein